MPKDDSITGDFVYGMLLLMASMDKALKAQRTKAGMKKRIEDGLWLSIPNKGDTAVKGKGGRNDMLVMNSDGKPLEEAFKWKDEGHSEFDIKEKLKSVD